MDGFRERYEKLKLEAEKRLSKLNLANKIVIYIGSATCENAAGAESLVEEFQKHIKASSRNDIFVKRVGCTGRCSVEPIVSISRPKEKRVTYCKVTKDSVHDIFIDHVVGGKIIDKLVIASEPRDKSEIQKMLCGEEATSCFFNYFGDLPFFSSQSRVALRNSGIIDPNSFDEFLVHHGFESLVKVLEKNDPLWVIDEVSKSHLRGRGGAGFPTGKKWSFAVQNEEKERYMICNADEGDPGAFMDRSMLESDPFSIIEGMMIAGFAIGAKKGFFYIRAEYPLAVERIRDAIKVCRDNGLLGKSVLGSNFTFDLEIKFGAGAFVCGEETALIHSIEGERGQPRVRPPYPAVKGLWGKPTIINNVETLANVPVVIAYGGDKFAQIGTPKSGGTKVFAVSGNVKHTGLVEVPMGITLREIVFDICGGIPNDKKLKAVQTGGPAGGCIPASLIDTVVDYDSLVKVGSMMGSGGLIVLNEDECMVNFAHFFISFSQNESCGKCTPCREGTMRMLEILGRIISGQGVMDDLKKLRRLAELIQKASLCGLGRAAPNPVLSTMKYFYEEYETHVKEKKCPAKACTALIHYEIDPEKCVGCTMCARSCPVNAITGERKLPHFIEQTICIKCGKCLEVCRFNAVKRL